MLSEIMTTATADQSGDEPSTINRALEDEQELRYMVSYTIKDDKLSKREEFFCA